MWRVDVDVRTGALALAAVLITSLLAGGAGATARYLELSAAGPDVGTSFVFSSVGSKRFFTTSAALVASDTDGQNDVYMEDANGQVTLVSGGSAAQPAGFVLASADGTHVVFATRESLLPTDTDSAADFYMWSPTQLELVSKEPAGSSFNFAPPPQAPVSLRVDAISQDGGHVVFDQLVGPTNAKTYFEYRSSSQSSAALPGTGDPAAAFCGISPDGSRIVLRVAPKLVPEDTDNGFPSTDVYAITNGQPTLISTGPSVAQPNGNFQALCAGSSADFGTIFFATAEPLVPEDTNSAGDTYEWSNGQTTLAPLGPSAALAAVSPDAGTLVFATGAQLVAGDADAQQDLYAWSGGQTTLLSTGSAGGNGAFDVSFVGSSRDATVVYFRTQEQLVAADTNTDYDLYERIGGQTVLVPSPFGQNDPNVRGTIVGIVPDTGDLVVSTSVSFVAADTDTQVDVYDWNGSAYSQVSPGNGAFDATPLAFTSDGTRIAFQTAESLLPADTDGQSNVYLAAPVPPDSAGGAVSAGGTVSTGATPTPADPLETSVTSPSGGTITITEGEATGSPAGFQVVGMQAVVNASVVPAPTAANPLTIVFDLDGSLLAPAGLDHTSVQVLKDGVLVGACTTSTPASPDPCVSNRAPLAGGGAAITIRTSHASTWQFGKPTDSTPPVVTPTVTGTLGSNAWYRSDVTVSWTISDPETAISSSSGCSPSTLSTDSGGTTYSCSATSGGGTTTKTTTVKRDATAPTVTFGSHPAAYTVDQTVAITCSATDDTSGIATSCEGINRAAYVFQVGSNTVSSSATDNAGNTGTGSTSFTIQVTTATLCTLTKRFVQTSPKYTALSQSQRNGPDGALTSICQNLAKQNAGTRVAYKNGVSALAQQGYLTRDQATILAGLADKL